MKAKHSIPPCKFYFTHGKLIVKIYFLATTTVVVETCLNPYLVV